MEKINGELCPLCQKKTLILNEEEIEIPYFGKAFVFGMHCEDAECDYKISDVEFEEEKDPCKCEFEINSKKDFEVRFVKSGSAVVKIPALKITIEPGIASEGYVTNIEGFIKRIKKILEDQRDTAEDDDARKKAKNLLKKIWKVECGDEKLKIIIEDPTGNSAIISEKTVISKLRK